MGFEIGPTIGTLYKIKEDGIYEELARMSIDNCPSFDGSEEDDAEFVDEY